MFHALALTVAFGCRGVLRASGHRVQRPCYPTIENEHGIRAEQSTECLVMVEPDVTIGPASAPNASEQCTMGVGCDQYGVCFAEAHGRPDQCPHYEYELEAYGWNWLDAQYTDVTGGSHANDRDYSADQMIDAFMAGHAQGMAARSGETGTGSTEGNSAVGTADASEPTHIGEHHVAG